MRSYGRIEDRITWLPLDAVRIGLRENNPEQEKWNGRVLTSMARSDMLRLVGFRRDDDGRMWIGVNLLRHDLSAGGAWEAVERMRAANRDASAVSLRGVLDFAGVRSDLRKPGTLLHDPRSRAPDRHADCDENVWRGAGCSPPGLPVVLLVPDSAACHLRGAGWSATADSRPGEGRAWPGYGRSARGPWLATRLRPPDRGRPNMRKSATIFATTRPRAAPSRARNEERQRPEPVSMPLS